MVMDMVVVGGGGDDEGDDDNMVSVSTVETILWLVSLLLVVVMIGGGDGNWVLALHDHVTTTGTLQSLRRHPWPTRGAYRAVPGVWLSESSDRRHQRLWIRCGPQCQVTIDKRTANNSNSDQ